jgi:putative endonuclease
MPRLTQFFVYIMTNKSRTLYIGSTRDLEIRVEQHRSKVFDGFTARYNIDRLVYYEAALNVRAAIERERQLKGWTRAKKVALIDSMNPRWRDLSEEWRMDARDPSHSLRMTDPLARDAAEG